MPHIFSRILQRSTAVSSEPPAGVAFDIMIESLDSSLPDGQDHAVTKLLREPAMLRHWEEIKPIVSQVKQYHDAGQSFRIYHGSTNSTRPASSKSKNIVDTSGLNKVLSIDNMKAIVQVNVPMDILLEETLKRNLVPLVVTEFPGITVGGAFSGTAGESSSFKHGFFDQSVSAAEVIQADGKYVFCSKSLRPDLFQSIAGSLGTVAVVTLLHIRLQQAYKFVEVTYYPVSDAKEAVTKLQEQSIVTSDTGIDFLDGIMFSATKGVVITGRMVDVNPHLLPVQRFIRPRDPWFFEHAQSCIAVRSFSRVREIVPLPDYIFRYNRGIFWLGKQTLDTFGIKNTANVRRLTHHAFTARMGYARLHQQPVNTTLIQDLAIPLSAADDFLQWVDQKFGIYPLWLCPLRVSEGQTLHPHHWKEGTQDAKTPNLMLNVGVYDVSARTYDEWINHNREFEDKIHALGGMKWSYAAQMYDEDRFWEQHDREWYDAARHEFGASSMPDIYDKTRVDIEAGREIFGEIDKKQFSSLLGVARYAGGMAKSIVGGAWRKERSKVWYDWPDPD